MATDRQIEANRRNAGLSSGPRTEAGKARSRANATKHGMAGVLPDLDAGHSPEFLDRRARWADGNEPADEPGRWALDRAIAATFRIERCERSLETLVAHDRRRAELAWDEDRALEAETIAVRLPKEPALTSRRLRTTLAGVEWLINAWLGLLDTLEAGRGWSEAEASKVLDLLGYPLESRAEADPPDTPGLGEARKVLIQGELERLVAFRDEAMVPLDELECDHAMSGDRALLSKPARLILRYERDAWRRHRESIRQVQERTSPPPTPNPPAPVVVDRPKVVDRPETPAVRPPGEKRRAPLEEAASRGFEASQWAGPLPIDDDSAWLDQLDRRIGGRGPLPTGSIPVLAGGRYPFG